MVHSGAIFRKKRMSGFLHMDASDYLCLTDRLVDYSVVENCSGVRMPANK